MFFRQSLHSPINALASTSRLVRAVPPPPSASSAPLLRSISERASPSSNKGIASPTLPTSPPLPSNRPPPPPPKGSPGLGINFYSKFSDIPSSEALASILQLARSITPAELAPLPPSTRERHIKLQAILALASNMDNLTRKHYFQSLDAEFVSQEEVEARRKEVARMEVAEGGKFDEYDAGTMKEWEEAALVGRVKVLKGLEGAKRRSTMKWIDKKTESDRRKTMARRDVRRELKEREEKEEKGVGLMNDDT